MSIREFLQGTERRDLFQALHKAKWGGFPDGWCGSFEFDDIDTSGISDPFLADIANRFKNKRLIGLRAGPAYTSDVESLIDLVLDGKGKLIASYDDGAGNTTDIPFSFVALDHTIAFP